jgi:hypothetical protein
MGLLKWEEKGIYRRTDKFTQQEASWSVLHLIHQRGWDGKSMQHTMDRW